MSYLYIKIGSDYRMN